MQPIISLAYRYVESIDIGEVMLMAYMCNSESVAETITVIFTCVILF